MGSRRAALEMYSGEMIVCAWLARRYAARQVEPEAPAAGTQTRV